MATNDYIIGDLNSDGKAGIWIVSYPVRAAIDEADAVRIATAKARQDVPDADVQVLSTKRTPTGRYTITLKRIRNSSTTQQEATTDTTTATPTTTTPATKATKTRKANSDMATKKTTPANDTATDATPDNAALNDDAAPFVVPAPGEGRITLQVQQALAAQGLRRCAGIKKMGHAQHDAPLADFGKYAAGLLGLDTVCKESWRAYTKSLRDAKAAANAELADDMEAKATAKAKAAPAPKAPKAAPAAAAAPKAPGKGTKAAAAAATKNAVREAAKAERAAKVAARRRPAPAAAPVADTTAAPVAAEATGDAPA